MTMIHLTLLNVDENQLNNIQNAFHLQGKFPVRPWKHDKQHHHKGHLITITELYITIFSTYTLQWQRDSNINELFALFAVVCVTVHEELFRNGLFHSGFMKTLQRRLRAPRFTRVTAVLITAEWMVPLRP